MISKNLFLIMRLLGGILSEFVSLNEYDRTDNNPWGGKVVIIWKPQNDINISDGTRSSMILWIMKEVSLLQSDVVKFKPNPKGWSKTGRKSIIDMDYQEA